MTYISTLSGGKDSTTMTDLLLRNNYPLDYIVFKDTLHEFELMYKYIERLSKYFKERYDEEIIILKPEISFEDSVFGRIGDRSKGKSGWIRGIPVPKGFPCTWRRDSKLQPFKKWLKGKGISEYKIYIGFTTDEPHRKMKGEEFIYPLIDDFKMSETDCANYLKAREMQNPLYNFFTRTGCSFCPAQSDRAFYQIYKHFKTDWAYMKEIEKRLFDLEAKGNFIQNKFWFSGKRTCEEMESKFKEIDRQGSLFDFSDEPIKDCFCKI